MAYLNHSSHFSSSRVSWERDSIICHSLMSRRLMILSRNLIGEWSPVSHLFSTSRPRCDWELLRVESPLLQWAPPLDSWTLTGPSGSQTLIRRPKGKPPKISAALDIFRNVFPIPMCDTGLSGGGPALQLTVHSTQLTASTLSTVTLHSAHTAWL